MFVCHIDVSAALICSSSHKQERDRKEEVALKLTPEFGVDGLGSGASALAYQSYKGDVDLTITLRSMSSLSKFWICNIVICRYSIHIIQSPVLFLFTESNRVSRCAKDPFSEPGYCQE